MHWVQFLIIIAYFILLISIGWFARRFAKSASEFLVAGRNMGLVLVTVSVVGQWLGGMSTIGTAEEAYQTGFFPLWYNISTGTGMFIFGLTIAVIYRRNQVHTVGEMIEKIFNKHVRTFASLAFLIAFFVLSYLQLQAIGSLFSQLFGQILGNVTDFAGSISPVLGVLLTPYNIAIIASGLLVLIYVYEGGMKSIALTNFMHIIVLFVSIFTVFIIVLVRVGGYGNMFNTLHNQLEQERDFLETIEPEYSLWLEEIKINEKSIEDILAYIRIMEQRFLENDVASSPVFRNIVSLRTRLEARRLVAMRQSDIISDLDNIYNRIKADGHIDKPSEFTRDFRNPISQGWGRVFAWLLGGILSGFASQASIQPVFAAKDIKTAKLGAMMSAFVIMPLGIFVSTMGIAVRSGQMGVLPANNAVETLPYLLMNSDVIPAWISGLAAAGILAAILSTVAPVMFAVSTIVVKDFYQNILNPEANDKVILKTSKLTTLIVGLSVIPMAMFIESGILDTAYLTYGLRASGAIIVLIGIYCVSRKTGKTIVTSTAAAWSLIIATIGTVLYNIFGSQIQSALGINIDRVYIAIFLTVIPLFVLTPFTRKKENLKLNKEE